MLMPKRVKRRKQFRGNMRGKAMRGNNGSDGAGHVAVVEKINSDGSILVSESGAHNFIFRTSIIKKPYNLRGYELEGFIYLPGDYSNSNDSNSNNNKDSAYKTFVKGVQDAFGARVDGITARRDCGAGV